MNGREGGHLVKVCYTDEMSTPTVTSGVLQRTSPSAITLFSSCETAWFMRYVAEVAEVVSSRIANAQKMGTAAHKELEDYLNTGKRPTDVFAVALLKYAPTPGPDLIVEGKTEPTLTIAGGVPVTGRIDIAHCRAPGQPMVGDWKTRSDLGKYQQTPEELSTDIQMVCYAKWASLYYPNVSKVDVVHFYCETKEHKGGNGKFQANPGVEPKTDKVLVEFTLDGIETVWLSIELLVERMKTVAGIRTAAECGHPSPEEMASKESPCLAFGGCPYRWSCPHWKFGGATQKAVNVIVNKDAGTLDFAARLAQKRAGGTAPVEARMIVEKPVNNTPHDAAVSVGEADEVEGIVPPDAPKYSAPQQMDEASGAMDAKIKAEQATLRQDHLVGAIKDMLATPATTPPAPVTDFGTTKRKGRPPGSKNKSPVVTPAAQPGPSPQERLTADVLNDKCVCGCSRRDHGGDRFNGCSDPSCNCGYYQKVEATDASLPPLPVPPQHDDTDAVVRATIPDALAASDALTERIPLRLFINCNTTAKVTDLREYVRKVATEVATAGGALGPDPRIANKDSLLAYGGWKGAMTLHIIENPPTGDCVIWTRGDELAEVVAATLSSFADEVTRGQ